MLMFQNQKYWMSFIMVYRFLPERIKIEKIEKLATNFHDKKRTCYTHKIFKANIKSKISIEKSS